MLGAESGTLASQNYPGTYPSNVWCRWKLRVSEGRTLRLLFGDFDVEDSPGCANGSLRITEKNGEPGLGNVDERHSISTPSLEECWSPDGGGSRPTVAYTTDTCASSHLAWRTWKFDSEKEKSSVLAANSGYY